MIIDDDDCGGDDDNGDADDSDGGDDDSDGDANEGSDDDGDDGDGDDGSDNGGNMTGRSHKGGNWRVRKRTLESHHSNCGLVPPLGSCCNQECLGNQARGSVIIL